ncbi:MAG: translocation/assembly module TamB domain-containing protein, partial [Bdellovibrionota bacterium]
MIKDPKSRASIPIEQISASISLFYSLPLLALQKIHISEANITGLSYNVTSLRNVKNWVDRLRPKSRGGLSTSFQTYIEEIRFEDLQLKFELSTQDLMKTGLLAELDLKSFSIRFDGDDIEAAGELTVNRLKAGAIKLNNLKVELLESQLNQNSLEFVHLSVSHLEDLLEIKGGLKNWESPDLNLAMKALIHLENYSFFGGVQGEASVQTNVSGPWKSFASNLSVALKDGGFRGAVFEEMKLQLKGQFPSFDLESFSAKALGGLIKAKGQMLWDESKKSKIQIETQDLQLGQVLRMIDPDFREWQAAIRSVGDLEFYVPSLKDVKFRLRDLEAENFVIKNDDDEIRILEVPWVKATGEVQTSEGLGSMNFQVNTSSSSGELAGSWRPREFGMSWLLNLQPGDLGLFYGRRVGAEGKIPGVYGGRVGQMEMILKPALEKLQLNDFDFKNLRGEIRLRNRRLFGQNLESDGLKINGGLQFQPGDLPTFFSDLEVEMSQLDLRAVWTLIDLKPELALTRLGGRLSGALNFNDWVASPKGAGSVLVQEVRLDQLKPIGRLAKFNWNWNKDLIELRDFYFESSKDGGGIRGEADLKNFETERLKLRGVRAKLSDLSILLDLGLKIQSLIDFDIDFNRSEKRFELGAHLFDTFIGTLAKGSSRFNLSTNGASIKGNAQIFDEEIAFDIADDSSNQVRANLRFESFDVFPNLLGLPSNELEIPLSGEGQCDFLSDKKKNQLGYMKLFSLLENFQCAVEFRETKVLRANTELHKIQNFEMNLSKRPNQNWKWKSSAIKVLTRDDELSLKIDFENTDRYDIEISGATRLESISYFIPFLSRSDGLLQIDGRFNQQGFFGSVDLKDGLLLFQDSPLVFRNVESSLRSLASRIDLQSFSAETRDGSVTASGQVQLGKQFEVLSGLVSADLNGLLVEPQAGFRFRASGPLRLKIEDSKGHLDGRLSVMDGSFRRRLNLRTDLLKIFQPRDDRYRFIDRDENYYDSWTIAIQLNSLEPLIVRNNIIDASVDFMMEVKGSVGRPRLAGRVTINSGLFNWNNRRFSVQAGSIQFSDPQTNIPR